ncbi:ArsR family transcriptional regulator [Microbacterium laevaniformans]|uniref:ArsR family transcriptional regulator n=2 Tax=Microbacterium TaxID=33882 RepID=A0A4S2D8U5_9MICO|nr:MULTISPECIES: helix-turn-helix domain-containing protein [Microbacterium]AXA95772.1 transcriptional regulator [Microbacterium sp. PM5]KIC56093.1 transcriptional regulator [Microbacterium hominis]MDC7802795.1 helix-turn-helix domain-containing protein [Sphingomonas sp. BLCC-B65]TGY38157.1 ArsR family transcriptional regulator [Microbacterium laevaniformans]
MTPDDAPDGSVTGRAEERRLDAGALRALAHPLRIEIFDILNQYGPQTASSLAAMTGESSGATSYHLRALAKHDLIREISDRGTGRERWWERPRGGISFTNPEAMKTPAGKAATQLVMSEFLTRRHQQLMRYVTESLASPDGLDEANAMVATSTLRLTPAQTEALITEMHELVLRYGDLYRDQTGEDLHPISIRTDVFPLPEDGLSS